MIKLVCPNCMKTVSVPEDAAGKDAPCPECGKPFPVPARYTPTVAPAPTVPPPVRPESPPMSSAPLDRPAPPPGLVPPPYPSPNTQLEPPLPPPPPPPPIPFGYTRSRGVNISPTVLAWVPAVCLTVIFLLTFFPWVGSYVGRTAVYTQTAWRAAFGGEQSRVRTNFPLEDLMKRNARWPDGVVDKATSDWALLVPYILVLILALVIAWAERMVATLDRARMPPQLRWAASLWPYRIPMVAGLATVALLVLVIQMTRGFGLERAFGEVVSERFAEERKASATSPQAQAAIDFKEDEELARYNLERTTWLYLALGLNILVVVAMVGRAWLDRRGNKPPPRIVFQY